MGGAGSIPLPIPDRRKQMSFIQIQNAYFRTPEYIDFMKKMKSVVYYFLLAAVIRGSDEVKNHSHPAYYIYKEHFLKKQLVGRYSQKKLAEYLKTSQSRISTNLEELEQDGMIKKISKPTKIGNILYYQFGTWEGVYGEDSYKEHIWSDEIFQKYYVAHQKEKEEKSKQETKQMIIEYMFDGDAVAYEKYEVEQEAFRDIPKITEEA